MTKYSEERMFPEEPDSVPLEFVNLWLKQYEEHVARYRFFTEYAKNKNEGVIYACHQKITDTHEGKRFYLHDGVSDVDLEWLQGGIVYVSARFGPSRADMRQRRVDQRGRNGEGCT